MNQKIRVGARYHQYGVEYEIVHIDRRQVHIAKTIGGTSFSREINEFNEFLGTHGIELRINGEGKLSIPEDALEVHEKETRDFRVDVVTELLNRAPIYSKRDGKTEQIIEEVSAKHGQKPRAVSSVAKWVKKYRDSNFHRNSLLNETKAPLSRFLLEFEKVIETIIEKKYLSSTKINKSQLAGEVLLELRRFAKENGIETYVKFPSLRTLRRRVEAANPAHALNNRHGNTKSKRILRAAGKSISSQRALYAVEADGNILDILAVTDDEEVIGRPYLTVLIDRYSRCILAFTLSHIPFSALTLLNTLKHAYNQCNELPGGKIERLIVDNGSDYISDSVRNLCSYAGTSIEYCPPRNPNSKPFVERFFRTLNDQLVHALPGSTFSNPLQRGEYNSEEHACMTLDEIKTLIKNFIDIYHRTYHLGLKDVPRAMWEQSRNKHRITTYDAQTIDAQAKKVIQVKITKGRVGFRGYTWYSHALTRIEHEMHAKGEKFKVKVLIDELDISSVNVVNPYRPTELIQADSTSPDGGIGETLFEYLQRREASKITKDGRDVYLSPDQALIERIEMIESAMKDKTQKGRKRLARSNEGQSGKTENTLKQLKRLQRDNEVHSLEQAIQRLDENDATNAEDLIFETIEINPTP